MVETRVLYDDEKGVRITDCPKVPGSQLLYVGKGNTDHFYMIGEGILKKLVERTSLTGLELHLKRDYLSLLSSAKEEGISIEQLRSAFAQTRIELSKRPTTSV